MAFRRSYNSYNNDWRRVSYIPANTSFNDPEYVSKLDVLNAESFPSPLRDRQLPINCSSQSYGTGNTSNHRAISNRNSSCWKDVAAWSIAVICDAIDAVYNNAHIEHPTVCWSGMSQQWHMCSWAWWTGWLTSEYHYSLMNIHSSK